MRWQTRASPHRWRMSSDSATPSRTWRRQLPSIQATISRAAISVWSTKNWESRKRGLSGSGKPWLSSPRIRKFSTTSDGSYCRRNTKKRRPRSSSTPSGSRQRSNGIARISNGLAQQLPNEPRPRVEEIERERNPPDEIVRDAQNRAACRPRAAQQQSRQSDRAEDLADETDGSQQESTFRNARHLDIEDA